MPSYEIKAVGDTHVVTVVATVDTATAAIIKLRDALEVYRRAWAIEDTGRELRDDELLMLSWDERNRL